MDHHWLNWLEDALPSVELAFLTPGERQAWRDSREGFARGAAELRRLKTLQEDVRWGRARLSEEQQERLRQFLAARGETTAGDRFVLNTLRGRARERQRFWLGLPLGLLGAVAAGWLAAGASRQGSTGEAGRDSLGQ
jgi:zinc/manganese transport system permease protein